MAYDKPVSRNQPSCLVFLLDQSSSMEDPWGGGVGRKCDRAAICINDLIDSLLTVVTHGEEVRNYFDLAVIGYGATVGSAFRGGLQGRDLVSLVDLADNKEVTEGSDGDPQSTGWIDPVAENGTPMGAGFEAATRIVEAWLLQHRDSYPPTIFNITDGQPNDLHEAERNAARLCELETDDGNVLLFNIHISESGGIPLLLPSDDSGCPDDFAKMLFRMSSSLPEKLVKAAQNTGINADSSSKAFAYNSDSEKLLELIEIGSRLDDLR